MTTTTQAFIAHKHDAMVHTHEHVHITHHAKGGSAQIEHLVSTHSHEHNHAAVDHSHAPHRNVEQEHSHEAHIHNHEHPATDR